MLSASERVEQCKLLVTGTATKANVLRAAQQVHWLHMACHYEAGANGGWLALVSAAAQNDRKLSVLEVAEQLVVAQGCCVVLSTCLIGRGDMREEGVVGLANKM